MNDYERLAERIAETERSLDSSTDTTEDTDILDLLEDAANSLAQARLLAEGRA